MAGLNGPSYGTSMYSAYSFDNSVNSAPRAGKWSLATFSSNSFGSM